MKKLHKIHIRAKCLNFNRYSTSKIWNTAGSDEDDEIYNIAIMSYQPYSSGFSTINQLCRMTSGYSFDPPHKLVRFLRFGRTRQSACDFRGF